MSDGLRRIRTNIDAGISGIVRGLMRKYPDDFRVLGVSDGLRSYEPGVDEFGEPIAPIGEKLSKNSEVSAGGCRTPHKAALLAVRAFGTSTGRLTLHHARGQLPARL